MQEWKIAYVNNREVPVLISDEKEALLAAKAAGRAIVGLWRPEQAMDEISAANYVVENVDDATEEYLERVARRHLGWPWRICETERLVIREMFADDFDDAGLYGIEHRGNHGRNDAVIDVLDLNTVGFQHVLDFHAVLVGSTESVGGDSCLKENLIVFNAANHQIGVANINCKQHRKPP